MVSLLRTLLVVLLALPAVALPPGVSLEWCRCWNVDCGCSIFEDADAVSASGSATSCDCERKSQRDERPMRVDVEGTSCPSCPSLEAGDFEPGLESAKAVASLGPLACAEHRTGPPSATLLHVTRFVSGRAPPGSVRPPGLLPGTQPLLR